MLKHMDTKKEENLLSINFYIKDNIFYILTNYNNIYIVYIIFYFFAFLILNNFL